MSTAGPSCDAVLPETYQIDLRRHGRKIISVKQGAAVSRSRPIDQFKHGVTWRWRGVWVFVMNVSWYEETPYRWVWDWGRCDEFSYETLQLVYLHGFRDAKLLTDLQAIEPAVRVETYLQSWSDGDHLGVDGVPFKLHAIQDPTARDHAVQAYRNEQARLHVY